MALQKEYESPISQLAEICKTVNKMPGVLSIGTNMIKGGKVEVHMKFNDLLSLSNKFVFTPLSGISQVMEMSLEISDVKLFSYATKDEWNEWCTSNHHCKVCGSEQEEKPVENQLSGERARGWFCPNHCTDWIPVSA